MSDSDIFTLGLGLGLTPPWRVVDQRLASERQPHELRPAIAAPPGERFPRPTAGGRASRTSGRRTLGATSTSSSTNAQLPSSRVPPRPKQ